VGLLWKNGVRGRDWVIRWGNRILVQIVGRVRWGMQNHKDESMGKGMVGFVFIGKGGSTTSKQGDRLIPRCEGRAVMESRRNQFPLPPSLLESIAT
jgi:hypothetical protein